MLKIEPNLTELPNNGSKSMLLIEIQSINKMMLRNNRTFNKQK